MDSNNGLAWGRVAEVSDRVAVPLINLKKRIDINLVYSGMKHKRRVGGFRSG